MISPEKSVLAKPSGLGTIRSAKQLNTRSKLDQSNPLPRLTFDEDPPAQVQSQAAEKSQHVNLSLPSSGAMMNKQVITPSYIPPQQLSELEPGVDLDPNLEIPFSETSVEAMFRPPELKDFFLPPFLGEYVKG